MLSAARRPTSAATNRRLLARAEVISRGDRRRVASRRVQISRDAREIIPPKTSGALPSCGYVAPFRDLRSLSYRCDAERYRSVFRYVARARARARTHTHTRGLGGVTIFPVAWKAGRGTRDTGRLSVRGV